MRRKQKTVHLTLIAKDNFTVHHLLFMINSINSQRPESEGRNRSVQLESGGKQDGSLGVGRGSVPECDAEVHLAECRYCDGQSHGCGNSVTWTRKDRKCL